MRFFRNFHDLRGHSRGNPRSGLIFMGGGGGGTIFCVCLLTVSNAGTHALYPHYQPGLGSSTVDQVLKYTKYPKYIPSTSTGQVLIFLKST